MKKFGLMMFLMAGIWIAGQAKPVHEVYAVSDESVPCAFSHTDKRVAGAFESAESKNGKLFVGATNLKYSFMLVWGEDENHLRYGSYSYVPKDKIPKDANLWGSPYEDLVEQLDKAMELEKESQAKGKENFEVRLPKEQNRVGWTYTKGMKDEPGRIYMKYGSGQLVGGVSLLASDIPKLLRMIGSYDDVIRKAEPMREERAKERARELQARQQELRDEITREYAEKAKKRKAEEDRKKDEQNRLDSILK